MISAILVQPEQARLRIAGLRARRQRADLGESEAQMQQRVGDAGVLVEARRHAERVGKVEAEHILRQIIMVGRNGRQRQALQREHRHLVRALGVDGMKQGQREGIEKTHHSIIPEKSSAPSARRWRGRAKRASAVGSGA